MQSARELRYLIADPTSSRRSLRKLLKELKVPASRIDVVDKFSDAARVLDSERPGIVFADQTLDGEGALALLELQKSALKGIPCRVFFLSTQRDSLAVMSGAAEEKVDGLLLKPFTFDSLQTIFVSALRRRIAPTPYEQTIEGGAALFNAGRIKEAMGLFEKALLLSPRPALACFWEGQSCEMLERTEEASRYYAQGLSFDPLHYRCLLGMVQLQMRLGRHQSAYEAARMLAANHTVPMKQVSLFIRVSIYNFKFDEVLGFYEDVDAMLELEPQAAESLAAALVVAGVWLLRRGLPNQALDAFRKADVSSQGNEKILRRMIVELIAYGFRAESENLLARLPEEAWNDPEFRIARLRNLMRHPETLGEALQLANELIYVGQADPLVYEFTIRKSVEVGRNRDRIRELIDEASRKFPEQAHRFKDGL